MTRKKTTATKKTTRKYSPAAGQSVRKEMDEMKAGKLRSGGAGKKVPPAPGGRKKKT